MVSGCRDDLLVENVGANTMSVCPSTRFGGTFDWDGRALTKSSDGSVGVVGVVGRTGEESIIGLTTDVVS